MNFLFTTYIYPLQEPVVLSPKLGISLDNPRSEDEISYVEEYLKNSHENSPDLVFPPNSDEEIITLDWVFECFSEKYLQKNFQSEFNNENIYRKYARCWIIARFNDHGSIEELKTTRKEMSDKKNHSLILLEDDHPILSGSKNLKNYFSLLSLLCHTEGAEYYGRQIITDSIENHMEPHVPNRDIWRHPFLSFMFFATEKSSKNEKDSSDWRFFQNLKPIILKAAGQIETTFQEEDTENLLYIGSILDLVTKTSSEDKTKILFLTSILEFLLTHNPDYNRFNVEDSISKQFQLKTAIVAYLNDKTENIQELKKRLKTIYNVRSCIAHGNFKKLKNITDKIAKHRKSEFYMDEFVTDLYRFVRSVLETRLNDREFIEFLKES